MASISKFGVINPPNISTTPYSDNRRKVEEHRKSILASVGLRSGVHSHATIIDTIVLAVGAIVALPFFFLFKK